MPEITSQLENLKSNPNSQNHFFQLEQHHKQAVLSLPTAVEERIFVHEMFCLKEILVSTISSIHALNDNIRNDE